jgi:regulator of sirC expression with transglutaminase-like and TPR domain
MDFSNDFSADAEFLKLLRRQDDQVDLTTAALELARDAYPKLSFDPTLAWIEGRAAELRGPMTRAGSDEAILGELAECLALHHGIIGSSEIYEHADGSFLNRVIEQKTGIPISLSVLYMAVAKSSGIELLGVGAPGHFLTRYETFDKPLFVDAYAGGSILTYTDCVRRLEETQGVPHDEMRQAIEPVGPRSIIIRMLNNLKALYVKQREWPACWKVQHRLLALQPSLYGQRRDWAVISLKAGRVGPALEMLDACLKTCPAEDKDFLEQQKIAAHGKLAQWN